MANYDYHSLSRAEQRKLVQERIARGFPAHRPPHLEQGEGVYFLTAACYRHVPHLRSPTRRDAFQEQLLSLCKQHTLDVFAWVILPNHYHLLVGMQALQRVPPVFKQLHGRTSRQWNLEDKTPGRTVWYAYYDRGIRDEEHFYKTLNYIHANPVRHGYVKRSSDWAWSSLSLYYESLGQEWLEATWRRYQPDNGEQSWDEDESL